MKAHLEQHILLGLLAVLGVTWIWYSQEPMDDPLGFGLTEAPIVGHLAPDFTLSVVGSDDATVTLSELTSRNGGDVPVVLNFWASWCGPCRLETPHFQELSLTYQDQVAILGINQGESAATIADFGVSFGLTYPLLYDADNGVNEAYEVFNLPTTIFIDRYGVVREVYVGAISQAVLQERINRLVKE
ncbi:MAG: TlpA family protein disulfide reductase [Ardenticatenaceae bacterium]|nr:TlpA family protein disulfide reductase [Anaerolineales bacterium]MCB8922802.1 TlpA family protein disulfide reductase [Ardenticatenaceae bacterium]MCB8991935.1 TlpA family protein disulfide reductase [Ardenticatenaceae bacterium]MCB9004745.1 TlpA family protein disulfide reductase [Ardenticatenaceae bacterium]